MSLQTAFPPLAHVPLLTQSQNQIKGIVGVKRNTAYLKNEYLERNKRNKAEAKSKLIKVDLPKAKELHHEISKLESPKEKQLFCGIQFIVDFSPYTSLKDKQALRQKIICNGGQVSYVVTRSGNILVTSLTADEAYHSVKHKVAAKYGIPVVSEDYVEECLLQKKLVDVDHFLFSKKLKSKSFEKGKISVTNSENQSRRVSRANKVALPLVSVHAFESMDGYELIKATILLGSPQNMKPGAPCLLPFMVLELHINDMCEKDDEKKYCVFTHEGKLPENEDPEVNDFGLRKCRYLRDAEAAISVYSQLYKQATKSPHFMQPSNDIGHPTIGSPSFQKVRSEWTLSLPSIESPVAYLVDLIWKEAIGQLQKFLTYSPSLIPLWKVEEAEGILMQLCSAVKTNQPQDLISRLNKEFYSVLPHHPEHSQPLLTQKLIAEKQDVCQLLQDMVNVSEASGWASESDFQAKYLSLRCHIKYLQPNGEEFLKIKNFVLESQIRDTQMKILNIFSLQRTVESIEFSHQLENHQFLFHASSASNLVGIFSRGLLLPKIAVNERGVERSDIGMLGNGIYFADAASTCVKYSHPSKHGGTRFLVVCNVALGCVYDVKNFHTDFTCAPEGFHSVHGVKATDSVTSDFVDDEFAIYNPNQQMLYYLVEFALPSDEVITKPHFSNPNVKMEFRKKTKETKEKNDIDLKDITEVKPVSKAGLQSSSSSEILPLHAVYVRAKLIDLVAKVKILQVYKNESSNPIEAKYVFPLETGSAVCGFEAHINGKHIVGEIKEKETAHREYRKAVSEGHGAYLMDEENHDVFTVSVGNLPPKSSVIISIEYVVELPTEGDLICFTLPSSVAPWTKEKSLTQNTQDVTTTKQISQFDGICSVKISVQMPYPIHTLYSPKHSIKVKKTETKAVIETFITAEEKDNFSILIGLKEVHVPRMWVESHPNKESQACMLAFYPEFEAEAKPDPEIVILIDASNSMKGDPFIDALKISLLCLKYLPPKSYFNVVAFGSVFQELFPSSQPCNSETLAAAEKFIKDLTPNLGNTELHRPLRCYHLLSTNIVTNVILVTDGHVINEGINVRSVSKNSNKVRIFTCAVSSTANKHFLGKLANVGSGAFEFFDPSAKYNWERKIKSHLEYVSQLSLKNVRVEWQNCDNKSILQAPMKITSLFSGSRQIVYGFIPFCNMAILKAEVGGQEISTVVYTTDHHKTEDTILHILTARSIISDWEYGLLSDDKLDHLIEKRIRKQQMLELSKEYKIVTSCTSFIAVEKRNQEEVIFTDEDVQNLVISLLDNLNVDILPYMEYNSNELTRDTKPSFLLSGDFIVDQSLNLKDLADLDRICFSNEFDACDEVLFDACDEASDDAQFFEDNLSALDEFSDDKVLPGLKRKCKKILPTSDSSFSEDLKYLNTKAEKSFVNLEDLYKPRRRLLKSDFSQNSILNDFEEPPAEMDRDTKIIHKSRLTKNSAIQKKDMLSPVKQMQKPSSNNRSLISKRSLLSSSESVQSDLDSKSQILKPQFLKQPSFGFAAPVTSEKKINSAASFKFGSGSSTFADKPPGFSFDSSGLIPPTPDSHLNPKAYKQSSIFSGAFSTAFGSSTSLGTTFSAKTSPVFNKLISNVSSESHSDFLRTSPSGNVQYFTPPPPPIKPLSIQNPFGNMQETMFASDEINFGGVDISQHSQTPSAPTSYSFGLTVPKPYQTKPSSSARKVCPKTKLQEKEVAFIESASDISLEKVIKCDQNINYLDSRSDTLESGNFFQNTEACFLREIWDIGPKERKLEEASITKKQEKLQCLFSESLIDDKDENELMEAADFCFTSPQDSIYKDDSEIDGVLNYISSVICKKRCELPLCSMFLSHLNELNKDEDLGFQKLCNKYFKGSLMDILQDKSVINSGLGKFAFIIKTQAQGGYWEEIDCLEARVLKKAFSPDLELSGLKSMGPKVKQYIQHLVSTLAMCLYVMSDFISTEFGPREMPHLSLERIAETLVMKTNQVENMDIFLSVTKGIVFAMHICKEYPLIYHSLELGQSWEAFILKYIT